MANGDMTFEEWQRLTPDAKEYEHFRYHTELNTRLIELEGKKFKTGMLHFFGSFAGGFAAFVAFLTLCKGFVGSAI